MIINLGIDQGVLAAKKAPVANPQCKLIAIINVTSIIFIKKMPLNLPLVRVPNRLLVIQIA